MPSNDIFEVDVNDIQIRLDNPQTQNSETFGNLVQSIRDNGFLGNILVAEGTKYSDKPYEVISGSHRLRATIVAGNKTIPVINLGKIDEEKRVKMLYNLNVAGKIDKNVLTELVKNMLDSGLSTSEINKMLLVPMSDIKKIIKSIEDNLPKDMKEKFDLMKSDIKTIEDLSRILNHLFSTYGDTLELGFMWFEYGGKDQFMLKMTDELHKMCKDIGGKAQESGTDINEFMQEIVERGYKSYSEDKV